MLDDNFIKIPFRKNNLDLYIVRTGILNAINSSLSHLNGRLLDIGCGKMPYKKYIFENSAITSYVGLDIESALVYDASVKPDFTWNGVIMPFEDGQFETALGTEVLEHCPNPEIILKEINRVLKPDGVFFFTVPFLWPLHEVPQDEFRYTPFALKRLLKETGFINIDLKATGGWHASMAQMLGLWVRRAPMRSIKRKLFSYILTPLIMLLIKRDKKSNIGFHEGQMITGISGLAYKAK